jgi:glycosyltransferase involved in cell wall biosynthesis
MNILLINHYAGSPLYGMEYRPYYFARQWKKMGHKVTIIASSFSHVRTIQPRCIKPFTIEIIDNIKYIWIKTPRYSGNGIKRLINMLSFTEQLYLKNLPIEKPDIVIDSSTYPLTIYGSYKIARKYKTKLIFEVHDLWPLSPIELGNFSKYHPFILILQYAEDFAYKHADKVVSLLPKAKEYMINRGMSPDKFKYIPNGIDISSWRSSMPLPSKHTQILNKLKQQNKFIVGYAGEHGRASTLEYLIKAAGLLNNNSKIQFVLVGKGPEKKRLQKIVEINDYQNVNFLPPIPKSSIPKLLSIVDILYIGLNQQPLFRFGVSPNKLFDYMMSVKPIIYAIDAGNNPVNDIKCGLTIPPENPQAIVDAILYLYHLPLEKIKDMGKKNKIYIEKHHNYKNLAKEFLEGL